MQLSWEQLQVCANAERRKQARAILQLGQLIVSGQGSDKNTWMKMQKQLLKEAHIGF